jgi:hypothetical protein
MVILAGGSELKWDTSVFGLCSGAYGGKVETLLQAGRSQV